MQKVGDVCENCRERWEEKKQEPKVLQKLGSTLTKNQIVPACEFCDGPALEISALDNRGPLQD